MEIVQAVKKLNSISRERLNFRRRPILCSTLYRNPMQVSNFGGTFDQLFLRLFLSNFHRRCLSTSSIPWCKKVKNDQKLKSRGSCLNAFVSAKKLVQNHHFLFEMMGNETKVFFAHGNNVREKLIMTRKILLVVLARKILSVVLVKNVLFTSGLMTLWSDFWTPQKMHRHRYKKVGSLKAVMVLLNKNGIVSVTALETLHLRSTIAGWGSTACFIFLKFDEKTAVDSFEIPTWRLCYSIRSGRSIVSTSTEHLVTLYAEKKRKRAGQSRCVRKVDNDWVKQATHIPFIPIAKESYV